MQQQIKTGTLTGTGAAINESIGFIPDYVKVVNETDGDTYHEWFGGMTDGHAIKFANHASAQLAKITSNGISEYSGSDSAGQGFTIGTDVSESGKTLRYIAVRNAT